jgi:hypothetical protein
MSSPMEPAEPINEAQQAHPSVAARRIHVHSHHALGPLRAIAAGLPPRGHVTPTKIRRRWHTPTSLRHHRPDPASLRRDRQNLASLCCHQLWGRRALSGLKGEGGPPCSGGRGCAHRRAREGESVREREWRVASGS